MFSLEQILPFAGTIAIALTVTYIAIFVWRLKRKYDLLCFLIGDYMLLIFMLLFIVSKFEEVPSLLSSLLIAELTLALVWVELSKRPELYLGDFVPIIHKKNTTGLAYKAGYHDEPPKPSLVGIKEVSCKDLKFNEYLSFAVDLSNIGYQDIMVHEYVHYINGKRQKPIPLGEPPYDKRLTLITQDRHTINIPSLHIKSAGFHKISLVVIATTVKCSKEVWFYISKDFKKLRYVEMLPYKRLLSPLIKNELKDP